MPALATPLVATPHQPSQTQALMTDYMKTSTGRPSSQQKRSSKPRQSLASATTRSLPSPAPTPVARYVQPHETPQAGYQAYYPVQALGYEAYSQSPPLPTYGQQPYHPHAHPYAVPMSYQYSQTPVYSYQMTPSHSADTPQAHEQPQQTPTKPKTRKYTKKAASWKENGGAGRARLRAKSNATAPPTAGSTSISDQFSPVQPEPLEVAPVRRRSVPVTTGAEGRRLDLTGSSSSASLSVSEEGDEENSPVPAIGPLPRLTTIPAVRTDADGRATLATADVIQSELGWLESEKCRTPERQTASTAPKDTPDSLSPESRATKTKRRLEAFSATASCSTSPTKKTRSPASSTSSASALISTRVEKFGRVALGKEAAVRWLGLEGTVAAVEETLSGDGLDPAQEDAWVQAGSTDGSASSPRLVRPDWPDDLAPWSSASSEHTASAKETAARKVLLTKYLETESEEEEEEVEHVFIKSESSTARGRGKSVWNLVATSPTTSPSGLDLTSLSAWQGDPADARSALLLARRNKPPKDLGSLPVYIACICGSVDNRLPMVSCDACHTWHHLPCIGAESPSQLGESWWCRSCESSLPQQNGLATPPPSSTRQPRLVETADATRIYRSDFQSLALAPSPMFMAGDRLRGLGTPGQKFRTPRIPSSAISIGRRMGDFETPGSPSSAGRSRILSYGEELDYAPSTPAARNVSNGTNHNPSTPRFEDLLNAHDDHHFDVTSTPSRHLDFTPAPFMFSTPMGLGGRPRIISATGQPLAFATPSQDFLKDLQHADGTPALSHTASVDSAAYPLSPYNYGSGSGSISRLPSLLTSQQHSPSPYGHRRRVSSGNKVSFAPASSSVRLSSRLGPGMGMALDEDDEAEPESAGKGYDGLTYGGLEGSSMR